MFARATAPSGGAAEAGPDSVEQNDAQLDGIPVDRLEAEITELASHIYAGTCRWLELVAEFDRRGGWGPSGCRSCAEWLAWRCALGSRAAREHVRVARALAELPRIHDRFAHGELSYAKVRALTRVATRECEEELVELARYATAAQLERIVRAHRRVTTREAREAHEGRYLSTWWDEDGSLCVHGRIAGEDAATVIRALDAARGRLWEQNDDAAGGSAEPPPVRHTNADALVRMAEDSLAGTSADRSGGGRTEVVVHVDAGTLSDDRDGRSHADGEVAIAPETARRLACDSSVVSIVESADGAPLSVGRRKRTIPPAIRRALLARDRACRFPGCENRRFVDAHHITHWARGGETRLDNLVLLCRRHHRLVHEGGFAVERLPDGEIQFRARGGWVIDPVPKPPRGDPTELARANTRRGAAIDPDTCLNGTGEKMDLGLALDAALVATGDY